MSGGTIHGVGRRNPSEGLASKFPYRCVCSSKHWLKVIMAIVDSNKVLQLPILFLFFCLCKSYLMGAKIFDPLILDQALT